MTVAAEYRSARALAACGFDKIVVALLNEKCKRLVNVLVKDNDVHELRCPSFALALIDSLSLSRISSEMVF